jgi:hypothetical protein
MELFTETVHDVPANSVQYIYLYEIFTNVADLRIFMVIFDRFRLNAATLFSDGCCERKWTISLRLLVV